MLMKPLLINSFAIGAAKMSPKHEDLVARSVPLVTTNDHVLEQMS